jgi:hypothetical protein
MTPVNVVLQLQPPEVSVLIVSAVFSPRAIVPDPEIEATVSEYSLRSHCVPELTVTRLESLITPDAP